MRAAGRHWFASWPPERPLLPSPSHSFPADLASVHGPMSRSRRPTAPVLTSPVLTSPVLTSPVSASPVSASLGPCELARGQPTPDLGQNGRRGVPSDAPALAARRGGQSVSLQIAFLSLGSWKMRSSAPSVAASLSRNASCTRIASGRRKARSARPPIDTKRAQGCTDTQTVRADARHH
jgi:hypothetical protein